MNNLLTTVSGYFSRSLILGAFLPTVIFIIFFILLVIPLLPDNLWLVTRLQALGTEWKVISMTFTAIVASGLLYNLNIPLIRIYEGYPLKNTWYGKWKIKRYQRQYRRLDAQQKGMRTLLRAMGNSELPVKQKVADSLAEILRERPLFSRKRNVDKQLSEDDSAGVEQKWDEWYGKILNRWTELGRHLRGRFPGRETLVLPTALGNVIRSFEYYPDREYGMDSITLYPRLISKIDKEYAAIIDDSKTAFDFMLNCSALSAILALCLFIIGLITTNPLSSFTSIAVWVGEILLFFALSRLAYAGAIYRAGAWGETIKSAFDLYRNALLPQLGFPDKPPTKSKERDLWDRISLQILDGDRPEGPRVDYNEASASKTTSPTYVTGNPPTRNKLTITRGVKQLSGDNIYQIFLTVRNEADDGEPVRNVVVTDTLPGRWCYLWESAKLIDSSNTNGKPIKPSGINPYHFPAEDFSPGEEKTIVYKIAALVELSES